MEAFFQSPRSAAAFTAAAIGSAASRRRKPAALSSHAWESSRSPLATLLQGVSKKLVVAARSDPNAPSFLML